MSQQSAGGGGLQSASINTSLQPPQPQLDNYLKKAKTLKVKSEVTFARSNTTIGGGDGWKMPCSGNVSTQNQTIQSSKHRSGSILKKSHQLENVNPVEAFKSGGGYSTSESLQPDYPMFKSKSPLIDQSIMSTIGPLAGAATSFTTMSQENGSKQLMSLAEEYKLKQREMDERLKKDIEAHKVAKIFVPGQQQPQKDSNPLQQLPISTNDQNIEESKLLPFEQKPQKFVRSQRSIAMRIKESYEGQVGILEQEKVALIQKLNDTLVLLDKLNQEKGDLNDRLLSIFKFNRDIERQTLRSDDLGQVVDESLKEELRKEKQQSVCNKEQLKLLQSESVRLVETLAKMEALKEEIAKERSELQQIFDIRDRDYNFLHTEYLQGEERLNAYKKEVDELRQLCTALTEMISGSRHDLHHSHGGKLSLNEQFQKLESKYVKAVDTLSRELQDLSLKHTRKKKLYGANFMAEKLIACCKERFQSIFDTLKRRALIKSRTLQGLLRMRRLLRQNRRQRLRKAIYRWYFTLLKPLRTLKQNKSISLTLQARNPVISSFFKWRSAFLDAYRQYHIKQTKLERLIQIKERCSQIAQQNYLLRWKHCINLRFKEWNVLKRLGKMVVKRDEERQRTKFYRWKAIELELQNSIQVQAMAQRFTLKTYLTSLFLAFRRVTSEQKNQRQLLLKRTLKSFLKNIQINKQLRCQALILLREQKLRKHHHLLKCCFSEIRLYKQRQKHRKINYELFNVEIPLKEQTVIEIATIQREAHLKTVREALTNVLHIKMKRVYQNFQWWRDYTQEYRERLTNEVRQRAIKRYHHILGQAFNTWVDYRGKTILGQQMQTICDWNSSNKTLINEIRQENLVIDEQKLQQRTQSAKSLKTLIMEAFQRHLREKFQRWRLNVRHLASKQIATQKILNRLDKRYKKLTIFIYKSKVVMINQELKEIQRGDEARVQLSEQLMQRSFSKMRKYAKWVRKCKDRLYSIMRGELMRRQSEGFKQWVLFNNIMREMQLEGTQNKIIDHITELQGEIGVLADQKESQNVIIKQLSSKFDHTCMKVLVSSIARQVNLSHQFYFSKWREHITNDKRKQVSLKVTFSHVQKQTIASSFVLWQKNSSVDTMQKQTILSIQGENKVIHDLTSEAIQSRKKHELEVYQAESQIQRIQAEAGLVEGKYGRCLTVMMKRKTENHSLFKLRYILIQWRSWVAKRKSLLEAITQSLQKSLWQSGFTAVKEQSRNQTQAKVREIVLNRFFQTLRISKEKWYFSQWKSQGLLRVNQATLKALSETRSLCKDHKKLVRVVYGRVESQVVDHLKHKKLFDTFIAWVNQIRIDKALKAKTALYMKGRSERGKVSCLVKWMSRDRITKAYRKNLEKMAETYTSNIARQALEAWKEHNWRQKQFCRALSSYANKFDLVFTTRAFSHLKEHSDTSKTRGLFSKFKSCQFLFNALNATLNSKKSQALTHFRIQIQQMKRNEMAARALMKYWVSFKIRGTLQQWRDATNMRKVKIFNTVEGPVALETHNLSKEVNALKVLCLEEGIAPEKILQVVQKAMSQGKQTYMKVVTRLLCLGNPRIRNMPHYFDRWRQWVKLRKLFSYWLNYTSQFTGPRSQGMASAFRLWKTQGKAMIKELKKLKKEQLEMISVRNDGRLSLMSQSFHEGAVETEELAAQRDLLLVRYVGSQKLALSSIKAQNERAKSKAFSQWLSQNQRSEKAQIEDILKSNLLRIGTLKDRITYLEDKNHKIADENEDLRRGALDGIDMAKSCDELSRGRDVLTIDIAKKALTIRRLLEDNANLQRQLSKAQEAASELIKQAQRRLGGL